MYRDGALAADLPVGSAEVPGNLLDADAASLESATAGTAGWTAGPATRVTRTDSAGAVGGAALQLTATAGGQLGAYSRKVSAVAGTAYTTAGSFQAGAAGRRVRAGLAFTDASGKITRLASAHPVTVDPRTGWVTTSYSAAAPVGTVGLQAMLLVEGVSTG